MELKLIGSLVLVLAVHQTIASRCPAPQCDSDVHRNTLWSHDDPYKYWQCRLTNNGEWIAEERNCANTGVKFSFEHQVCVWPEYYVDSCNLHKPAQNDEENIMPKTCDEEIPTCVTQYEQNTLYAHADVTKFWQCKPNQDQSWSPIERPCAPTTWFCKDLQVCIFPIDWTEEKCGCNGGGSTEAPSTTVRPTTPKPTTPVETTPEETTSKPTTSVPSTTPISTTTDGLTTIDNSGELPIGGNCDPKCDTLLERGTHWAHPDKTKFWQCKPNQDQSWSPIEMPCAPSTWFCFGEQVCIHPVDWDPIHCGCDNIVTPSTSAPSTTQKPTTSAPTTSVSSTNDPSTNDPSTSAPTTSIPTTTDGLTTIDNSGEIPIGTCDPKCETDYERNTLWPHEDQTKFYQCVPNQDLSWSPMERPCAPSTWFCYGEQVCIHPVDWDPIHCGCEEIVTPSTSAPSTTQKPSTTSAPTTSVPSTNDPSTNDPSTSAPTTSIPTTTDGLTTIDNSGEIPIGTCDPKCETDYERNTLWPHEDQTKFYQCVPNQDLSWSPMERPCAPSTWFCFGEQVCIHPVDWDPIHCGCDNIVTPSTSAPSTTQKPTTSAPTTSVPSTNDPSTNDPSTNDPSTSAPTTSIPTTTDGLTTIDNSGEIPIGTCDPKCETDYERNTLWPHEDQTKFYQCVPNQDLSWSPMERPCAPSTWFCYGEQVCIHPVDWDPIHCGCEEIVTPSTSAPSTTQKPSTTSAPTTLDPIDPTIDPIDPIDDPVSCRDIPDCSPINREIIWPSLEPENYVVCENSGEWKRVTHKCRMLNNVQQLFHFKQQECVHPDSWEDFCADATDPGLCKEPRCVLAEFENDIKFAHFNPRQYYRCKAVGKSVIETCAYTQLFIAEEQKCGDPCKWVNTCRSPSRHEFMRSFFSKFL